MDDGSILPQPAVPAAASEDLCRAKLFMHGGSQAVRLPKAFRFEGSEVTVRKQGDAVILEPIRAKRPPTREEMEAFWRHIDELRGDLEIAYPERDRSRWRDPPVW